MEIQTIDVKGRNIGEAVPCICYPVTANTQDELYKECDEILKEKPDIVEWRADYFHDITEPSAAVSVLHIIRKILPDYPVIFTMRNADEGGFRVIDTHIKSSVINEVINSRLIDIIDIELMENMAVRDKVLYDARKNGMKVILSYHDFTGTPEVESIIEKLIQEQLAGADIAKVAFMPNNYQDVLHLLNALLKFKERYAKIPTIAVSMAGIGTISRAAGFLFGSSITYSSGINKSAPGQVSVSELRTFLDILIRNSFGS